MKDTIVKKVYEVTAIAPIRFSKEEINNYVDDRVNFVNSDGDNMYTSLLKVKDVTKIKKIYEVTAIAPGRFSEKEIGDFMDRRFEIVATDDNNRYSTSIEIKDITDK